MATIKWLKHMNDITYLSIYMRLYLVLDPRFQAKVLDIYMWVCACVYV